MTDLKKLLAQQEANRLADEAIARASGRRMGSQPASWPTFLVTSFAKRSDVPVSASLRRMTPNVVAALAAKGLIEPISLTRLPKLWWKVHIDAAEAGEFREYGCFYVTQYMSSERLAKTGFEVVDGPFEPWANVEVAGAILGENPGKYWDARISNRPLLPLSDGSEPYAGSDNSYTSTELLEALNNGQTITVFSGPYASKDDAAYALDLRWESPE